MKTQVTIGIGKEILEQICGFKIDTIEESTASACGTAVFILLTADLSGEELIDDTIN